MIYQFYVLQNSVLRFISIGSKLIMMVALLFVF